MKFYHFYFYVRDRGDLKLQAEILLNIYLKYSENYIRSTGIQEKF